MDVDDRRLREAVRDVGGGWNKACLFILATSTATRVNSETGTTRKKIPRSKVAPKLLEKLDACKLIFEIIAISYFSTSVLWPPC